MTLFACDSGQVISSGLPEETVSPIDGQVIVTLPAAEFADGSYMDLVRDDLAGRGPALIAATSASRRGDDAPVLLKDLFANAPPSARVTGTATEEAEHPSTHIAVQHASGEVEHRLLALDLASPTGEPVAHARGGSAEVFVVGDPDLDEASEVADGAYTKTAVSLADPTDERTVTFSEGTFSVEGSPDAILAVVSTIPVVDGRTPVAGLETCEDAFNCGPGGGGGGDLPDEPGPTGPPTFPSHVLSSDYLAIRTLRTDEHSDHGPKLEVQMHVQPTDNYGAAQFAKKNNYRFDTAYFSHVMTTIFGTHTADSYVVYGPPGGPAAGTANTHNAVPVASLAFTRWFKTPDVNHQETDYHFTGMQAWDWQWENSPYPSIEPLGYLAVQGGQDGFPLHPLTASPWRGIVVEDDTDVRHFTKRADGDWEGTVQTYDFASGAYANLYTEIDADPFSTHNDDVFTKSGYRRATLDNVQRRLSPQGQVQTDANGFRYTFMIKRMQVGPY